MFGRRHDYACAVTNSSARDTTAIAAAYSWVRDRQRPGEQILLWTHLKGNLSHDPLVERIARERDVVVATERDHGARWVGGPILGLWMDTEDLAKLPYRQPTAMCIVPWVPSRLAGWVRAVNAEILGDGRDWAVGGSTDRDLDPVVVRGLETMTLLVNQSNTVSAGYEKDVVVAVLLTLHDAGYPLPSAGLQSWALANGWRGGNANELAKYCSRINAGSRPRARRRNLLRPDALSSWRTAVAEASTTAHSRGLP